MLPAARWASAEAIECPPMAPKQRQVRMEQRGALEAIQALEQRSDEELEAETKYKSAALAILGARASERFDAEAARAYFQRAIAAARPQERMQLRRMADASLALAERRAGDLKQAVERLGQEAPSGRQMLALRAMGLLMPAASAGGLARIRGVLLIILLIVVLLALGLGVVELVSLPFGGVGIAPGVLLGLFVVIAVLGIMAAIGRRKRDRARAPASG
jgi:tetratricopeptide (TPR) repeat protein